MTDGPNPLVAATSMLRARRVSRPAPTQGTRVDHDALVPVLDALESRGINSLLDNQLALDRYRDHLMQLSPDEMSPAEALAYWLNLYNAGALRRAATALESDTGSVFRIPGAFTDVWATVDGEALSLDDIEHGKIRRFGDPRVHAALVCGSVSCPTLRYEPFDGAQLDAQLDQQMRVFLESGGAALDRTTNTLKLSRIFLWYGRDFTHPESMPELLPASTPRLRNTVAWWLDEDDQQYVWENGPTVEFLAYDWGLACSIA